MIDHREVLFFRSRIPNEGRDVIGIDRCLQPAGIAGSVAFHQQYTHILLEQIPGAFAVFSQNAGIKGACNVINILVRSEAIGPVPIRHYRCSVNRQIGIVVAFRAGDGQLDRIAQLVASLFCGDHTVFRLGNVDNYTLGIVFQLKGNHSIANRVAIKSERNSDRCVFNATGITGIHIGRKIDGTNLNAVNIDIRRCAQNLHPVRNTVGHCLLCLLIGERIVVFPNRGQGTARKGLHPELTVIICMVQAQTEILSVGELENIDHTIIPGLRRQILTNGGNIIAVNLGIQPSVLAGSRVLGHSPLILIGDIPDLSRPMERRACHINGQIG